MAPKKKAALDGISPDPRNANLGTDRGRAMVQKSLEETGAGRSILVDKHGKVIAGNKTLSAWGGLAEDANVEVVHTDGHKLVVVQRDDLDLDEPNGMARKLAYYDNRTSEIDLAWNAEEVLKDIDAGMDLSGLWSEDELKELLKGIKLPDGFPEYDESVENDVKFIECPECGHKFPQ